MKYLLILCLLFSTVANAQPGYTTINSRYNWLAGKFNALSLPAYGDTSFQTGQYRGAGAVLIDTTGADKGLYVWYDNYWHQVQVGAGSRFGIEDTVLNTARHITIGNDQFTGGRNNSLIFANHASSDSITYKGNYPDVGVMAAPYEGAMIVMEKVSNEAWNDTLDTQYGGIELKYRRKDFDSASTRFRWDNRKIIMPTLISQNKILIRYPRDSVNQYLGQDGNNGAGIDVDYDMFGPWGGKVFMTDEGQRPNYTAPAVSANFDFQRTLGLTRQRQITGNGFSGFLVNYKTYQANITPATPEYGNRIEKFTMFHGYGATESYGTGGSTKEHIVATDRLDTVFVFKAEPQYKINNGVVNGYGLAAIGGYDHNYVAGKFQIGGPISSYSAQRDRLDVNGTSVFRDSIKTMNNKFIVFSQAGKIWGDSVSHTGVPDRLWINTNSTLGNIVIGSNSLSATAQFGGIDAPGSYNNKGGVSFNVNTKNQSTAFFGISTHRGSGFTTKLTVDSAKTHIYNKLYLDDVSSASAGNDSMVVWNPTTKLVGMRAIPSGGGGGSGITTFTDGNGFDGTVSGTDLSLTTSLTSGSVPYIGASGALSQNTLFLWDNTNTRLSIGSTSSNIRQLNVRSTTNISAAQFVGSSGSSMAAIDFAIPSGSTMSIGAKATSGNFAIANAASLGGTELFSINRTSGNVGIGVTSPDAKLTIAAGTATAGTAPIKLTTGTLLTIPENGAVEMANGQLYATMNTSSRGIVQVNKTVVSATSPVAITTSFNHWVWSGTTATFTLPAVAGNADIVLYFKNRGSGNMVIDSNAGGNDIYSTSAVNTITLTPGQSTTLRNDGTYWNQE